MRIRPGRRTAAVALTLVCALGPALVMSAIPAAGQEVPSPTPTADPTDSPTPTPTPEPTTSPDPTTSPEPSTSPTGDPTSTPTTADPVGTFVLKVPADPRDRTRTARADRRSSAAKRRWADWTPSTAGRLSTARLDREAARDRAKGWSTQRIARAVYAPFPVMGPASWTDSWGAPRFTGGYHPHAGQDVLCRWGAPVLAVEAGSVSYGFSALGGNSAYLARADGSFWYYAHLSSFAGAGQTHSVKPGDIIGRCGDTGDATVPHVHFGFYTAARVALDPMHALTVMLRQAEHRLHGAGGTGAVPTPDADTALPPTVPPVVAVQAAPAPITVVPAKGLSTGSRFLLLLAVLWPLPLLSARVRNRLPAGLRATTPAT